MNVIHGVDNLKTRVVRCDVSASRSKTLSSPFFKCDSGQTGIAGFAALLLSHQSRDDSCPCVGTLGYILSLVIWNNISEFIFRSVNIW